SAPALRAGFRLRSPASLTPAKRLNFTFVAPLRADDDCCFCRIQGCSAVSAHTLRQAERKQIAVEKACGRNSNFIVADGASQTCVALLAGWYRVSPLPPSTTSEWIVRVSRIGR